MKYKWDGYTLDNCGLLEFRGRLYVPENDDIRRLIMEETHRAPFFARTRV